jgi:ABC-type branched-subunit amino acid transport system substrate-binding protein
MKKLLCLLLLSVLFNSSVFADKIKIGIIGPFSGDWALIGDGVREGIVMAQESHKNLKHQYEFIYEDSQIDPLKVGTGTQKLINVNKVDALITILELSAQVVNPLAEKYKIPNISLASGEQVAKGDYNFTHYVTMEDQAAGYVSYLKKEKLNKVALYWIQAPTMKALRDEFIKQAKVGGIEVIEISYQGTERNFRPMIQNTIAKKVDISVLFDYAPTVDILAKQMKDLNAGKILGCETYVNSKNHALFEGIPFYGAYGPTESFEKQYEAKYKKTIGVGTGNGYDIANLYIEAYETFDKKPTAEQLVKKLSENKSWEGAMGPLTMDKEGVVHSKTVERKILNGKSVIVK